MKALSTVFVVLCLVATANAERVESITIEALVDGPSALHVRPDTIYWENIGNAKPGKWNFADEPTYVNDVAWKPKWKKRTELRGADISNYYSISLGSTDLTFELISVSKKKGGLGIEKRTPISTRNERGDFIITIPDPEREARWYKFVVGKKGQ